MHTILPSEICLEYSSSDHGKNIKFNLLSLPVNFVLGLYGKMNDFSRSEAFLSVLLEGKYYFHG